MVDGVWSKKVFPLLMTLVLADANDEKNILQQYEFMIDIAFVDDFGF